jgi:hypothetical protein
MPTTASTTNIAMPTTRICQGKVRVEADGGVGCPAADASFSGATGAGSSGVATITLLKRDGQNGDIVGVHSFFSNDVFDDELCRFRSVRLDGSLGGVEQ